MSATLRRLSQWCRAAKRHRLSRVRLRPRTGLTRPASPRPSTERTAGRSAARECEDWHAGGAAAGQGCSDRLGVVSLVWARATSDIAGLDVFGAIWAGSPENGQKNDQGGQAPLGTPRGKEARTQGASVRATRNPALTNQTPVVCQRRVAARRNLGSRFHEPPRTTRTLQSPERHALPSLGARS